MSVRILVRVVIFAMAVIALPAAIRLRPEATDPSTPITRPSVPDLPDLPEVSPQTSTLMRQGDYADARALLAPLATSSEPAGGTARLVLGLYAHQGGQLEEAVDLLSTAARGPLEDWRLYILADSAHGLGDLDGAQRELKRLVSDFPESPLRVPAIHRAAEIAAENELWETALGWIEQARGESLSEDRMLVIETLAWQIAQTLDLPELEKEVGRRILVEHPHLATELGVAARYRESIGELDWRQLLTVEELQRGARRMIETREPDQALEMLDYVPDDLRALRWKLLRAEALTGERRGTEALEALAGIEVDDKDDQAAVAWQRALASRDASKVRRGRANLPLDRRRQMRALALENLERSADLTDDEQLALRALRLLFDELSEDDDAFDRALRVLRRIQRLEPFDTTGASYLWRRGWQAYTQRDYSVAIGYWSELGSMYPGTNTARSGRYWTGRAHEALGHDGRSRDIYQEIVDADADDFYSRHARARLQNHGERSPASPSQPTEPWPEDPLLDRFHWLSDLGLDRLALDELEGLRGVVEPRAYCSAEAVALANTGQRRDSIRSLVCAFPALGKVQQTMVPLSALQMYYPLDFRDIIERRAREEKLSPYLVFAMVRQESAFDAAARSWAGARGLMQLMPATGRETARRMGLRYSTSRLSDPDFSVRLGTRYFRQVLEMFGGNQELALAGYNAGPYRIRRLWRQAGKASELDRFVEGLALEETKTYVKRVLLFEDSYKRLYPESG